MPQVTLNCPYCGAYFSTEATGPTEPCVACKKPISIGAARPAVSPKDFLKVSAPPDSAPPPPPQSRPSEPPPAPAAAGIPPVFMRDKFLFRQKHLAISEKYYVDDEQGQGILFIQRPAHLLRNLFALLAGLAVFISGIGLLAIGWKPLKALLPGVSWLGPLYFLGGFLAVGLAAAALAIFLEVKRHIYFYADDTKTRLVLEIAQDLKLIILFATYTVKDPAGAVIGRFRKNYLYDFFRKRWQCLTAEGRPLFLVQEDSIILSLLRRLLGPLLGLLRANFIFVDPSTQKVLGEFNRKMTFLDRYVLDMSADREYKVDRRLALAAGVLLDTGERR